MLKKYKKDFDYSYTLGYFPTMELVKNRPEKVTKIIFSKRAAENDAKLELLRFCEKNSIEAEENDVQLERLGAKENCFVCGVFRKELERELNPNGHHLVLVNPSDMGNCGTIIRTALGVGVMQLAIVRPAADLYDPKTVRASMGALFSVSFKYFDSFEEYLSVAGERILCPFMLNGKETLQKVLFDTEMPHSLIFGNESSGLPEDFIDKGRSIVISHSDKIDSLNLPISVGMALYEFCKQLPGGT